MTFSCLEVIEKKLSEEELGDNGAATSWAASASASGYWLRLRNQRAACTRATLEGAAALAHTDQAETSPQNLGNAKTIVKPAF